MRIDRRTTIKWVLAAAAATPLAKSFAAPAKGYGTDPDLQRVYSPGELWPLTLTAELRGIAAALCDAIIPPDAHSPGASSEPFTALDAAQCSAICDDICYASAARPPFVEAAKFFARYRDLTAAGFYTTPAGHKDLQYLGNVALASFEGPPAAVLRAVGLA